MDKRVRSLSKIFQQLPLLSHKRLPHVYLSQQRRCHCLQSQHQGKPSSGHLRMVVLQDHPHHHHLLGSNDPNTIPDPTRIRYSCFCMVLYVSVWTPLLFRLSYVYVSSGLRDSPVTFSCDFVDICFMFPFHYSLCFPRVHYVSFLHFLGLRSFPSTLFYCTLLIVLRSCSHIPLRRIRSLVYIPPVLVATTSELILLNSPLVFV